ncbi:MAG: hypothetical protein AAF414_21630 [Pseudomonadota bacterium]
MTERAPIVLIVSGPVGVGKSSVGSEVSLLLSEQNIAHTFVDLDNLAHTFPRPADDRFGSALAHRNLKDVWRNCAEVGSKNLILARVAETGGYVDKIAEIIPGSEPIVCRLTASDETLVARVASREIGSDYDWHAKRSLELSRSLAETGPTDFTVETDHRTVTEIAGEIVRSVDWRT